MVMDIGNDTENIYTMKMISRSKILTKRSIAFVDFFTTTLDLT